MIRHISLVLLLIVIISSQGNTALAESAKEYRAYMKEWEENRELATQYLLEAETALKEGLKDLGCNKQHKASVYGIKATQSLIKAMKANGSTDGIENFESGLNKWRELGDFC